ncbi:hypothetical protein KEM55_003591 [Ascosphaera atra]|nr:hypothetical protein KEM55_003591 [Ascosphaera atra]
MEGTWRQGDDFTSQRPVILKNRFKRAGRQHAGDDKSIISRSGDRMLKRGFGEDQTFSPAKRRRTQTSQTLSRQEERWERHEQKQEQEQEQEQPCDRLSNLSDELILHILSYLSTSSLLECQSKVLHPLRLAPYSSHSTTDRSRNRRQHSRRRNRRRRPPPNTIAPPTSSGRKNKDSRRPWAREEAVLHLHPAHLEMAWPRAGGARAGGADSLEATVSAAA